MIVPAVWTDPYTSLARCAARSKGMFGAARAAFARNVSSLEFWPDVREKASLFVRVACLVHVVRSYGVEATAVRGSLLRKHAGVAAGLCTVAPSD